MTDDFIDDSPLEEVEEEDEDGDGDGDVEGSDSGEQIGDDDEEDPIEMSVAGSARQIFSKKPTPMKKTPAKN